jgi:hypothetical protein
MQQSFREKYHYSTFTNGKTENSGRLRSLSKTIGLVNREIRIEMRPDCRAFVLLTRLKEVSLVQASLEAALNRRSL